MEKEIENKYQSWLINAVDDKDLIPELQKMSEEDKQSAFYADLEFGTAGLRGILGAGTNRMNIYVVRKATQGLANYIKKLFPKDAWRVAISYDSRIKSELFAKTASEVLAANEIEAFIYKELMPTPCLSFAVRDLKCAGGIMVTASHNPSKYNGYKVYGDDGCQITTNAANAILDEINKLDVFKDIKYKEYDPKLIKVIGDDTYDRFIQEVKKLSLADASKLDKDIKIIFTPLHGTGLKPVQRILKECGYNNVILVKEQEEPDGYFTTCSYPNPEMKEAMSLGLKYLEDNSGDILIATDPDADRVGVGLKKEDGYALLTGNEVGLLLFEYICKIRTENHSMPLHPVMVKTIVSSSLIDQIAKQYNAEVRNVLTGFKYIGEQIKNLEQLNRKDDYIFGFEESCGYLSGSHARDKDAINAVLLIAEMTAYYKKQGKSLSQALSELYAKYGYQINRTEAFEFPGQVGFEKMQNIMKEFKENLKELGGHKLIESLDYSKGINGLPKSNVLSFVFEDQSTLIIRPSGTEPKIKFYISSRRNSKAEAQKHIEKMLSEIKSMIGA